MKSLNNKAFLSDTQNSSHLVPKYTPKSKTTHVTIDNSDGRQQTITGLASIYHTNAKVVHLDLVERRLQIEGAMSVAATLSSKEGSSP